MNTNIATTAIVVLAILAAFALGRYTAPPPAAVPSPAVVEAAPEATGFRPARIALGPVPWHSTTPFQATFHNARSDEVIVAELDAAADFATINREDVVGRVILPGEEFELRGEIASGGRLGTRTSDIELMLTNGAIYRLTVEFDCFPTYTVQPPSLSFEEVDLDAELDDCTQTIVFRSESARIQHMRADVPWLEAAQVDPDSDPVQLAVHVRRDVIPHGRNVGTLHVTTDDPYQPEFYIRVAAHAVSRLRASPGHLFLRRNQEGMVRFTATDGTPARIALFETDAEGLVIMERRGGLVVRPDADYSEFGETVILWVTSEQGARTRVLLTVRE